MSFHLTREGPKVCTASKRACPLGGEHFSSKVDAERAYEAKLSKANPQVLEGNSKEVALVPTVVHEPILPQAGGRYFGSEVSKESIAPFRDAWIKLVGREKADAMEANKAARDRGYKYHLTVVSPPEAQRLGLDASQIPTENFPIQYLGVGTIVSGNNEAWFVACRAPKMDVWRDTLGLGAKDFHITLGFAPKDVYDKFKSSNTIVLPVSVD